MTLEVRYFASLVDRTGCRREALEVEPGISVGQLWLQIEARHPRLIGLGYRPLAACDQVYADWGDALAGVREIAFLPPVSGG